jgi:hypothetical protein
MQLWINFEKRGRPTNGEVIKILFPKAEISINEHLGEHGTVFFEDEEIIILYSLEWWNAPYRIGKGKNEHNGRESN